MHRYRLCLTLVQAHLMLLVFGIAAAHASAAKPDVPTTEASCLARGGQWTTLGLPMPEKPKMCDLRASDAGASCIDGSQCQGECLAPSSALEGACVTGQCSAYLANFGNVWRVSHGKAELLTIE